MNGTATNGLVAINTATCTLRPGFAPSFGATVRALDVAANGTVYAGGDFQSVNGQNRRFFGAVTAAGALTAWNPDADDPGRTLKVTPDGQSVLIGGDFVTVGGANSHALAVTAAGTGALTRAYTNNFIPSSAVIKDIVTDTVSGGWYVGGEGAGGASFDGRLAMDLTTFDQRWRDTCQGATQALRVYRGCCTRAAMSTTAPPWVASPTRSANTSPRRPSTIRRCSAGCRTPMTASVSRLDRGR